MHVFYCLVVSCALDLRLQGSFYSGSGGKHWSRTRCKVETSARWARSLDGAEPQVRGTPERNLKKDNETQRSTLLMQLNRERIWKGKLKANGIDFSTFQTNQGPLRKGQPKLWGWSLSSLRGEVELFRKMPMSFSVAYIFWVGCSVVGRHFFPLVFSCLLWFPDHKVSGKHFLFVHLVESAMNHATDESFICLNTSSVTYEGQFVHWPLLIHFRLSGKLEEFQFFNFYFTGLIFRKEKFFQLAPLDSLELASLLALADALWYDFSERKEENKRK